MHKREIRNTKLEIRKSAGHFVKMSVKNGAEKN